MLSKSNSEVRWARVFISLMEKLVRRLSPRVVASSRRSLRERFFSKTLFLIPMRICCWELPREKSPPAVP